MEYLYTWLITAASAIFAARMAAQTTLSLMGGPLGLSSVPPVERRKPCTTPIWGSRSRWANCFDPLKRVANLNPLPLIFAWLTVNPWRKKRITLVLSPTPFLNMSRSIKQPYRKSRRFDKTCRNHGSCPYCRNNRLYSSNKKLIAFQDEKEEGEEK